MTPLLVLCLAAASAEAPASRPVDYGRDVKPILMQNCVKCHGPDRVRAGLRLDTAAGVRKGGDSGLAVVPGQADKSRLLLAVTAADGVKPMPPKGPPLDAAQVAILRAWIDAGAAVPAGEVAAAAGSKHWSFQPVVRPAEPPVKDGMWVRNPIDRFLLARLEKEGVAPSPEADRTTLIRRLSLDLLGLPPSPKEVDAFVADPSPDAYEELVDRLLASPHYGERWGRRWLDLARYADSNGYSIDAPRSMWPYRDWVINAFNQDLPFDQFVLQQLAGDLLPNATTDQIVATGFHRNTPINQEGGIDVEQFRVESIVDRVNTTGTVFLGLTVGCCQCHDHKFDPMSQREYYQLFAFFNSVDEPTLELPTPEQTKQRTELQGRIDALEKELKSLDAVTPESLQAWEGKLTVDDKTHLPEKVRTILAIAVNGRDAKQQQLVLDAYRRADQVRHVVAALGEANLFAAPADLQALHARTTLEKRIADLKKDLPVIPSTLVVRERSAPRETHIHLGGDFTRKGAAVAPDTPAVLPPLAARRGGVAPPPPTRLDLAKWIVDPKNPLTARVTVNRMWQEYFGLGLVETENDFGTQGTPPSHPELLDWLASEFMARAWSMKAMHKRIVCSATYRQASKARPDLATLDPRNRLLARQNRLRLEAELVRDSALAASGLLTPTVGGPSVFPPQPQGVYAFTQVPREWKAADGPDRYRRGMYTFFWRSAPHPGLTVFDAPDATSACTRRNRSDTPLQALTLLNDQAFFECAQGLASRVLTEGGIGDSDRLAYGFRLCTARRPNSHEREVLGRLLVQQREKYADAGEFAAWTAVGRVLLNLDEFITRE